MSDDDYYLAELFAEHYEEAATIGVLRDGVSLLVRKQGEVTPDRLEIVSDGVLSRDQCESAVFALQNTGVLSSDGETLDRERLERVTRGAELLTERTSPEENELVATIPEGETSIEERHFGPLLLRLRKLVEQASQDVFVVNPFFSEKIADRLVNPLDAAAQRGVNITIVTRYLTYGDKDYNRNFVKTLFECEAIRDQTQLYEYVRDVNDLGGTVHAKVLIVDEAACYLGTANITHRGLRDNLELGVILRDDSVLNLRDLVNSLRGSDLMNRVTYSNLSFHQS